MKNSEEWVWNILAEYDPSFKDTSIIEGMIENALKPTGIYKNSDIVYYNATCNENRTEMAIFNEMPDEDLLNKVATLLDDEV
jgi:hypothetical protein